MTGKGQASGKKHSAATGESLSQSQRSLHILLAEDNVVNQRLTVRMLEEQGYDVTVVNNGKKAVDALDSMPFDLALMDVQMPEMDGLEATAAIRRNEEDAGTHLPIIAMTAHTMKGDRERCLAAGMDDYVAKPVKRAELIAAIENLLSIEVGISAEDELAGLIDRYEVMERVGGDMELLTDMVNLFSEDCPRLMSRIHAAIEHSDSRALEHVAHSLKGSVGNFATIPAFEAAFRLEKMGRNGDMVDAEEAYTDLEREIHRLEPALTMLGKLKGV